MVNQLMHFSIFVKLYLIFFWSAILNESYIQITFAWEEKIALMFATILFLLL